MSKRKRILIWLAGFVLLLVVYRWFFGVSTMFALQSHYVGWKIPLVKKVPVDLADHSVSSRPGLEHNFSGYTFELPWSDIDQTRSKTAGKLQAVVFESGNAILIGAACPREFANAVLEHGWDRQTFTSVYGVEPLQADFKMYDLMLRTTPNSVSIFGRRKTAAANEMMLVIKAIAEPAGAETGVFAIRTQHFQGFQYGEPSVGAKRITVDLFDEDGGLELRIFPKKDGPVASISQPEINRIIQSVRRVSVPELGSGC